MMHTVVICALLCHFWQGLSVSVHQEGNFNAAMKEPNAHEQLETHKLMRREQKKSSHTKRVGEVAGNAVLSMDTGAALDAEGGRQGKGTSTPESNAQENGNGVCNNVNGAQNGPFTCTNDFSCVNLGYVIRHACQACGQQGLLSSAKEAQCRHIAQGGQTMKGVKLWCGSDYNRATNGCVFPGIEGNGGWTNWGAGGIQKVCPCVNKYIDQCQNSGLDCILNKIHACPKLCNGVKSRMQEARGISFLADEGEDKLQEQAHADIEAHGKGIQSTPASMMSLDHSLAARSMSDKHNSSDDASLDNALTDKCIG